MERQISSPTFFLSLNNCIESTEELDDALFTTAVSSSRMLANERSHTSIVASNRQAPRATRVPTNDIYSRRESLNASEILIVVSELSQAMRNTQNYKETAVSYQVILSRNFYFVKLGKLKLGQIMTKVFQMLHFGSIVQENFQIVSPQSETFNQSRQRRLALNEVLFKRRFVLIIMLVQIQTVPSSKNLTFK